MLSRTDIQLEGLSIVDGLDSFTVFDLLRVSGAATLRSTLALRSVQSTARLRIELRPSGGKAAIVSGNAATAGPLGEALLQFVRQLWLIPEARMLHGLV